jgi:hypothetical protein
MASSVEIRFINDYIGWEGKLDERKGLLDTDTDWWLSIYDFASDAEEGGCEYVSIPDDECDTAEQPHVTTHAGMLFYLHACWQKDKAVVLRPDMIWFTIVSEVAQMIVKRPDDFKHLFTDAAEQKQTIAHSIPQAASTSCIDEAALVAAMEAKMAEPLFADAIMGPSFASAPPGAGRAIAIAMLGACCPFYQYRSTFCGIPAVDVKGTQVEWEQLRQAIIRLMDFPPRPRSGSQIDDIRYLPWLSQAADVVQQIITNRFATVSERKAQAFFKNIYAFGENAKCGSGHDRAIVRGWAASFYLRGEGSDLLSYNLHAHVLPHDNVESGRMFANASSLSHSILNPQGCWEAQYGFKTFEVTSKRAFDDLAMR